MALIDTIKTILNRLAPGGWQKLLKRHGLDITASNLAAELGKTLTVDRTVPGFEDFALAGIRAIEPGRPAHSLLFHALASPRVRTNDAGKPLGDFPTQAEIEAVENYVYGVRPPTLADLRVRAGASAKLALVVFSAEYRAAGDTVHRHHADMCFSRTGLARVGTAKSMYLPEERGFLPQVKGKPNAIRVLPSRYAAYIAVQRPGDPSSFGPMRFRKKGDQIETRTDDALEFWVPLHKLFPGPECIAGLDVDVTLRAFHVNEKLRRVHLRFGAMGQDGGWSEPDISRSPFIFHDGIADFSTDPDDGSGLLVPAVHAALVEEASYQGKVLTFRVPPGSDTLSSSLYLPSDGDPRLAPEYLHARQKVLANGNREDLNTKKNPEELINKGDFRAVHYIDYTGDGFVSVESQALATEIPIRVAAYSLVTAPDFFPSADQRELSEWSESLLPKNLRRWLWRLPPDELSNQRIAANVQIPGAGFDAEDKSATAIVSLLSAAVGTQGSIPDDFSRAHSVLPDAAGGIFQPGWDTSYSVNVDGVQHLAAYGLGSPFLEDAKLCAALSTFWPGVAPDAARTFEPDPRWPSIVPLTDEEIGITGTSPWDGIAGPREVTVGGKKRVEYTQLAHADYIGEALAGRVSIALTAQVDLAEYKRRALAMARIYEAMNKQKLIGGANDRGKWSVLSFRETVPADNAERSLAQAAATAAGGTLKAPLLRVELYEHGTQRPVGNDVKRIRVDILRRIVFYLAGQGLASRLNAGSWKFVNG